MKHDLVRDDSVDQEDPHSALYKCRRCGDGYWRCCWYDLYTEECPSNQLDLFALDERSIVVLY
jgi:hypothetical protein